MPYHHCENNSPKWKQWHVVILEVFIHKSATTGGKLKKFDVVKAKNPRLLNTTQPTTFITMSFLQQKQPFRVTFSLVPRLWLLWVFEAMHLLTVLWPASRYSWGRLGDMSKKQLSMFPVPTNQCHFVLCGLKFWQLHGTCNKNLWWFAMYSLSGWYNFLKTVLFSCLEVEY